MRVQNFRLIGKENFIHHFEGHHITFITTSSTLSNTIRQYLSFDTHNMMVIKKMVIRHFGVVAILNIY